MTIKRLLAIGASTALICVLFTQSAFSQTKQITGKVTDDKGSPVVGASVSAKGSKSGAATHTDGSFIINVPLSVTSLIISSVGYSQQEISLGDQTTVTVALVASTQSLNDVVVIGYGTVRRKDVTGAVASVQAKDFNQGQVSAPDQLLTNKVPGVEVATSSGQPGSATTIRVRGTNSILNTGNPLIVIDGV